MVVATYYDKVLRSMHTAIVSKLLKFLDSQHKMFIVL